MNEPYTKKIKKNLGTANCYSNRYSYKLPLGRYLVVSIHPISLRPCNWFIIAFISFVVYAFTLLFLASTNNNRPWVIIDKH